MRRTLTSALPHATPGEQVRLQGWVHRRLAIAAVVLVPASGAATIAAVEILSQGTEWPVRWPLAIPVLAPAMLIALALWSCAPSLHARMPGPALGGFALTMLALLSVAPWPLVRERHWLW